MNDCSFIILGATGDLTRRKLIPALYKLLHDKKVSKFIVVGAARDAVDAGELIERAKPFVQNCDQKLWEVLKKNTYYHRLDFNTCQDFFTLQTFVKNLEEKNGLKGNRLVYLATPSSFFCTITESIGQSGLIQRATGPQAMVGDVWHRIVYEKPFGLDLSTAHETNVCIVNLFSEEQIYRIDHYLTKELVSNIVLVRFTNIFFEPLWNNRYIDHVQITLSETLGIEERGYYYDQYGVLKDVVQNHALQLLSLVGMELPDKLTAQSIRDQKAGVLKKVTITDGLLGQYSGYTQEAGVNSLSTTPTFACLRFLINTPRWQGIPFYVKAGKRLERKNSSIHIVFKRVECTIQESCTYESDWLHIQIEPDANFSLQLNTKRPGSTYEVMPVPLTFSKNYVFGAASPEAYEILLEQIMLGDQSVSVRFDEIEYAWSIIDATQRFKLPLYFYAQLSDGPQELKDFDHKYNIRWR